MTVVVGTAGHIDHGKTSLLRAMTGIDADRLPEERRRGMTIDVGYAHLRMADGREIDFVDVPGHDRLVGNMLVGAGEIDAALLVVAADDGPRAQTFEHLELLDALGVEVGLAAVTKVDLVESARAAAVVAEVERLLARTSLAGSPVVAVSSSRGDGIAELAELVAALPARLTASVAVAGPRAPRLAIDRIFTVRGRGTVVTGSLRGGRLARGDTLRLEPGGRSVRARELQVHNAAVDSVEGGGRVAINLAGQVEPPPERGDVVTSDPAVQVTTELIALLRAPSIIDDTARRAAAWPPAAGSVHRIHLGTAVASARIGRGKRDLVDLADGRSVVRIRVDRPLAVAAGDRFVLRRPSPAMTIAGGIVLDPLAVIGPSRRRSTPDRLVALAAESGDRAAARLALHGVLPREGRATAHLAPDVAADLEISALAAVAAAPADGVSLAELRPALVRTLRRGVTVDRALAAAIAADTIDALVAGGRLARDGDRIHLPGAGSVGLPPSTLAAMDRLERALAVPAPPPLDQAAVAVGCPPDGVRALQAAGRIVVLDDGLAYELATFDDLAATALRLATAAPLSPAALRDATGTSRRYVMAILEELDRRGVLRRTPAGHVPGPRGMR